MTHSTQPSVGIVGGGLAGLAAALALAERGFRVELFEATRRLGGRAGSFEDPATGELIDHCQHLAMGCCTNFLDFCHRGGIEHLFDRKTILHFYTPGGRRADLTRHHLPAPLHLAVGFFQMRLISTRDALQSGRVLLRLARTNPADDTQYGTIGRWLAAQNVSPSAREKFWRVILTSALSETLEAASLSAARKVFRDGFLANPHAHELLFPSAPLGNIYEQVAARLTDLGVQLHTSQPVKSLEFSSAGTLTGLRPKANNSHSFDFVILALPWHKTLDLLPADIPAAAQPLRASLVAAADMPAAPITAVHLWFDRPLTNLSHAIFVGRLSQWLFPHGQGDAEQGYYHQVVISESRELAGRDQESIRDEVLADLAAVFPAASGAKLIRWKIITQHAAVFSPTPESEAVRPPQTTSIPNLFLAGDWTRTGWPATMEGAVRSGYLAAEGILTAAGQADRILQPDLPRGWLARLLLETTANSQ